MAYWIKKPVWEIISIVIVSSTPESGTVYLYLV